MRFVLISYIDSSFQYDLKNPDLDGKTLRVSFLPSKNGYPFQILINGNLLAEEHLKSDASQKITDRDCDISQFLAQEIEGKFVSIGGLETEKIHDVRLLKAD